MNIVVNFILLCFYLVSKSLQSELIYAVNCGGPRYYSKTEDILYEEDNGFNGGVATDSGKKLSPFPFVEDDFIYHTERYTMDKSLQYIIKLNKLRPGNFTIVLKFSEIHFKEEGKKTFSIAVGNIIYKQTFDIFKEVGFGVPMEEYIECMYDGENIFLNGMKITQGYSKEEKVLILALFKQEDNPKINAIVVYQKNASDVPKIERPKPQISIENILSRINKEAQMQNSLNNHIYIIDEPFHKKNNLTKAQSLYTLSLTLPGMVIIAIISLSSLRVVNILSNHIHE